MTALTTTTTDLVRQLDPETLEWAAWRIEALANHKEQDPTAARHIRMPYVGGLRDAARWLAEQAGKAGTSEEPEELFERALAAAAQAYVRACGVDQRLARAVLASQDDKLRAVVRAVLDVAR